MIEGTLSFLFRRLKILTETCNHVRVTMSGERKQTPVQPLAKRLKNAL
jgi:hypothetical protein